MVIHINPNRINTPASARPQVGRERAAEGKKQSAKQRIVLAEENFIPEPETLSTMIRGALASLREGMRFDRGSILNLLV